MYGKICPECGARLDPGEKCDCDKERKEDKYVQRVQTIPPSPTMSERKATRSNCIMF